MQTYYVVVHRINHYNGGENHYAEVVAVRARSAQEAEHEAYEMTQGSIVGSSTSEADAESMAKAEDAAIDDALNGRR